MPHHDRPLLAGSAYRYPYHLFSDCRRPADVHGVFGVGAGTPAVQRRYAVFADWLAAGTFRRESDSHRPAWSCCYPDRHYAGRVVVVAVYGRAQVARVLSRRRPQVVVVAAAPGRGFDAHYSTLVGDLHQLPVRHTVRRSDTAERHTRADGSGAGV